MKRALASSALAFWAFALCVELRAQGMVPGSQLSPPEKGGFRLKVNMSMALVEATVRDDKGRIVNDLKRQDFRMFEDDKEHQLTYSSSKDLKLSVSFVVDAHN